MDRLGLGRCHSTSRRRPASRAGLHDVGSVRIWFGAVQLNSHTRTPIESFYKLSVNHPVE